MEPKPELFLAISLAIFFTCLALSFMYKKGKKSKGIILPKDLKGESSSEYAERKEDDHRKFNNRKGW